MRRRATPSLVLAIALGGLAVLLACGRSAASADHGIAARTFTAVFVGDHGYRYRVAVKLKVPPVVPRLTGPPDMEYIIADPHTFDVTVENLTQGRRSPVLAGAVTPVAGVVSAWWRLPRPLRERAAVEGQKFAGGYADLSAVLSRKLNGRDPRHDVELEPGGTLTLEGEPIVDFGGGYFLPGGIGTWLVPRQDVGAWRAIVSHIPAYITVAVSSRGRFMDHAVGDSACGHLLLVWRGNGRLLPLRAGSGRPSRNCARLGILNPFR